MSQIELNDDLIEKWDDLRRAVESILTSQPHTMSDRASALKNASDTFGIALSHSMFTRSLPSGVMVDREDLQNALALLKSYHYQVVPAGDVETAISALFDRLRSAIGGNHG